MSETCVYRTDTCCRPAGHRWVAGSLLRASGNTAGLATSAWVCILSLAVACHEGTARAASPPTGTATMVVLSESTETVAAEPKTDFLGVLIRLVETGGETSITVSPAVSPASPAALQESLQGTPQGESELAGQEDPRESSSGETGPGETLEANHPADVAAVTRPLEGGNEGSRERGIVAAVTRPLEEQPAERQPTSLDVAAALFGRPPSAGQPTGGAPAAPLHTTEQASVSTLSQETAGGVQNEYLPALLDLVALRPMRPIVADSPRTTEVAKATGTAHPEGTMARRQVASTGTTAGVAFVEDRREAMGPLIRVTQAIEDLPTFEALPTMEELPAIEELAAPPRRDDPGLLADERPMGSITTNIRPPTPGEGAKVNLPSNDAREMIAARANLPDDVLMREAWMRSLYAWEASLLCHRPLYFEEINLERYGYSCCPVLQPVVSGAKFFATVPMLPYKVAVAPPREGIYSLGHYRPGSMAPYQLHWIPLRPKAGLLEAAAVTGLIFAIP